MESITLQTNNTIVVAGSRLGQVQFAASAESDSGAARLVAARIFAQGEGAFTSVSNPTSLVFATAGPDANGAVDRLRVSESGHFLPFVNNQYSIGQPSAKFLGSYAVSGIFDELNLTSSNKISSGILYLDNNGLAQTFSNVRVSTADLSSPALVFKSSGTLTPDISLNVLTTATNVASGVQTLSFRGSAGELFSITDVLNTGTIFSVNDISGLELIAADADGTVRLVKFGTNVAVGNVTPTQKLHVAGNLRVEGQFYDSLNSPGTSGQVLVSTANGTDWRALSEITGVDGVGVANYIARWSDTDTIGTGLLFDNGSNVGIGTSSPGTRLAVRGGSVSAGATDTQVAFLGADGSNVGFVGTSTNHAFQIRTNGGNNRITVTNIGNVGIATVSPEATLHVQCSGSSVTGVIVRGASSQTADLQQWQSSAGVVLAEVTSAGTMHLRASSTASAATQIPVFTADPASTTRELVTRTPAQIRSDIGAQAALTNPVTGTGSSGQVSFWNGTTTQAGDNQLFWDNSNKRLGIGVSVPTTRLHVAGAQLIVGGRDNIFGGFNSNLLIQHSSSPASGIGGAIGFANATLGTGGIGAFSEDGTQRSFLALYNRTSVGDIQERFRINSDGDVGIGTTSPTARIHAFTSTNRVLGLFQQATSSPTALPVVQISRPNNIFSPTAQSAGLFISEHSANFALHVENHSASPLFTVNGNGNVGIGTTTPTEKLDVRGTGYFSESVRTSGTVVFASGNTGTVGVMQWNDDDGTVDLGLKGGNVTLQIGQENTLLAFNVKGASMSNGEVVSINGAQGQRMSIISAVASGAYIAAHSVGVVTEDIPAGEVGFVTTYGTVRNLNTYIDGLSEGKEIFVSPTTPGGWTTVRPQAPNHAVRIGYIQREHASAGSIFVSVQVGEHLEYLHDVLLTTPSSGDIIRYDSSNGIWKNVSIGSLGLGTVTSIATNNGVTGGTITTTGTIGLTGQALALHNLATNGLIARTGTGTVAGRTITGTSNQVTVTNGDGVAGNPTLSLPQNIHTAATPTFGGATLNGALNLRASATGVAATQIPVFTEDPASTTRLLVTRTPAQILSDIGAQAALTNPVTGVGANGQVSFWTGTNSQEGDTRLIWDNASKRLGIGTTPVSDLHIRKATGGNIVRLGVGAANANGLVSSIEWFTNENVSADYLAGIRTGFSGGIADVNRQIQFMVGDSSTPKAIINGDGNVGIGTSSPSEKLHIQASSAKILLDDTNLMSGDQEVALLTLKHSVNLSESTIGRFDDNFPHAGISFKRDWTTTESTVAKIQSYGEGGWGGGLAFLTKDDDGSHSSQPLLTMDMTPDGNVLINRGNVGIGTSSPSTRLHISSETGDVSSGGGLTIQGTGTGARTWQVTPTASDTLLIAIPGLRVAAFGSDGKFYAGTMGGASGAGSKFTASNSGITVGGNYATQTPSPNGAIIEGNVAIGDTRAVNNFSNGNNALETRLAVRSVSSFGYHEVAHFSAGSDADDTGAIVRIGQATNDRGLFIKSGRGTGNQAKAIFGLRDSGDVDEDVMTFLEGGNVGIGTTSPTRPLHVVGDIRIGSSDPGGRIEFGGTSNVIYDSGGSLYINQGWSSSDRVFLTSVGAVTVIGDYNNNDSSSSPIFTVQEGNLSGGNTRFLVTKDGNVGVGIDTPNEALSISKNSKYQLELTHGTAIDGHTALIRFRNSSNTGVYSAYIGSQRAAGLAGLADLVFGTSPSSPLTDNIQERMRILSDGRIGIGTSTPNYNVDLQSTTNPLTLNLKLNKSSSTNDYAEIAFQLWSGASSGLNTFSGTGISRPSVVLRALNEDGASARGSFVVATFGGGATNSTLTEKFRIDSNGKVGVGTSTPTELLSVEGAGGKLRVRAVGNAGTGIVETARLVIGTSTDGVFPNTAGNRLSFATRWLDTTEYVTSAIQGHSTQSWGGILAFLTKPNDGVSSGDMSTRMVINHLGNVGIATTGPTARLHINTDAATATGVIVRGAASQSADLQQWQNSAGTVLAEVTAGGNLHLRASSTASTATQIPVFIGDPSSTTREIVTRTPAQLRADIGAQAELTNPVTGTGVSGRVSFWTGSTTQGSDGNLFWDNTNKRLGIGTTDPVSQIEVKSASSSQITLKNTSPGSSATPIETKISLIGYLSQPRVELAAQDRSQSFTGGQFVIRVANSSDVLQDSVLIDRNGNVGIGTTSPAARLQVHGTNSVFSVSTTKTVSGGQATFFDLSDNPGGNFGQAFTLFGYDTTKSSSIAFRVGNLASNGAQISLGNASTQDQKMYFTMRQGSNQDAMVIDTNLRIGVGTNSPGGQFHVNAGSAATAGIIIRGAASQSADLQQWQSSAGTVLAEVTAGGNLHFRASSTASAATQIPVFTGDPTSTTREILTRTPTQLRADMGAIDGTGVAGRVSFWSGTSTQSSDTNLFWDNTNKRLGIGTTTPSSDLEVNGDFSAKTKSFVIDHPTKPGKRLRYACLEGPENGVYFRGSTDEDIIKLPDYWHALVDEETITVNLTPVGIYQSLYVKSKTAKEIKVGGLENGAYDFVVYAERKDVSRLEVEC